MRKHVLKQMMMALLMALVVPCVNAQVQVGDILCTDGIIVKPYHFLASGKTPKGIVFYVDDSHTHGYAVDLRNIGQGTDPNDYGQHMVWSTQTRLIVNHNYPTNPPHWRDAIKDFNGFSNTQIIRQSGNANTYPAAYAVDFDNGWYLPAAGQVNLLFGELIDVNASLNLVGGTLMQDPGAAGVNSGNIYLWSSTEYDNDEAITLKIRDGLVKSVNKTTGDKYYVRSVINF